MAALPGLLAAAADADDGRPDADEDGDSAAAGCSSTAAAAAATADAAAGGDSTALAFPWSSPAALDDPASAVAWLRRIRQALPAAHGNGSSSGRERRRLRLAAHCWLGLLGLCRAWQAKDAALTHRRVGIA